MTTGFEKDHPLVRVDWEDSTGVRHWMGNRAVSDLTPLDCVSVGWLLRDDEKAVTLVASYDGQGEESNVDGIQCIPRSAVRKVERLRVSKRGSKTP